MNTTLNSSGRPKSGTGPKSKRALFAVLALAVVIASHALAQQAATPEVERESEETREEERKREIPEELQPKLAALTPEQLEFLLTPSKTRRFAREDEQLFEQLRKRTPEQVAAYVAAMMSVSEQSGRYREGIDSPTIPLNTASPEFNAWKTRRPQALNPAREAGPLSLGRYAGGGGFGGTGIPTFANAPIALTPEDLVAGKVDVAFLGAPLDMGSGWRDARHGPTILRLGSGGGGNNLYHQVNPGSELNIVDYGDVAVDNLSTERSMEHVREVVREIAETGAIPFIIGGDHSLSYPNLAGLADVYGKGKIGVVHFDSHYDAGRGGLHFISHGQPVYRVINEGHVNAENYIQVGLRAASINLQNMQWMREQGIRYHTMVEVERYGWLAVMERAIQEARENTEKLFISFDVDVLDPAYISGTGTPVPGGLSIREAMTIMRRLCAETDIVGVDIVEVAQYLDLTYTTALNTNYLINSCLSGIAVRRKGADDPAYREPGYLNPVATDHALDNYHGEQP